MEALLWLTAPVPVSSFDHTEDICIRKSITRDDTGLKIVKSLRLFWVFLWEEKSYPSHHFRREIVNLIKHQKLFYKAEAGAVGGSVVNHVDWRQANTQQGQM